MAWTYSQNFDALTDGDLTGQDSWSGSTTWDVQSTVAYSGTKAAAAVVTLAVSAIDRALPSSIADGDFFLVLRRSGSTGDAYVILRDGADANKMYLRMGSDGNISIYTGSVYTAVLSSYSLNTWYPVNIQFNDSTQPDQWRARAYSAGSWGTWTSWVGVAGGTYTSIATLHLEVSDGNSSATFYVDSIGSTDPTGGAATPVPVFLNQYRQRWN